MTGSFLDEQLMLGYLILSRYPILDFLRKKIILNLKIGKSKTCLCQEHYVGKGTCPMNSKGSFNFFVFTDLLIREKHNYKQKKQKQTNSEVKVRPYLICSGVPPEVAFVMAQAASFLVRNSAFCRISINTGKMFASITACRARGRTGLARG